MGDIQPARFLSHTGQIKPGVRRIVQVQAPAAGADWAVTVPGGVQWRILSGMATLTTSVVAGNRAAHSRVIVDGIIVWDAAFSAASGPSETDAYPIVIGGADEQVYVTNGLVSLWYQDSFYPQGAVIGTHTSSIDVADQWSGVVLWIEEYYFTNPQLSTIETLHQASERVYIEELETQYARQGGGAA